MPKGKAPLGKNALKDSSGRSFDSTLTTPDGNRSITRKETTPAFTHDGSGRPVTKKSKVSVSVPVSRTETFKPLDSPNHRLGKRIQVTPGKWETKTK
jgi:hypothetical protein